MNFDELQQIVREALPVARWEHTERVMMTACDLAEVYKLDKAKARLAALLHDYCKYWSKDDYQEWIATDEELAEISKYGPALLHGPVAAKVAKVKFGIDDPDVLAAICYHTSGRPDMSLMEKVIYLADHIEPGRQQTAGLDEIRKVVNEDLDLAMLLALDQSIISLLFKARKIFPLTVSARNYFLAVVTH